MSHFAELDENSIVTRVIVMGEEPEAKIAKQLHDQFGTIWKKTSYNTQNGIHSQGGTPFRKNYAGIGYFYDENRDAFIPPKPFVSWTLNEETCQWDAPISIPTDGKIYEWDEKTISWKEKI